MYITGLLYFSFIYSNSCWSPFGWMKSQLRAVYETITPYWFSNTEMLGVPNFLPRDWYQDDVELIHWR
jgi:hypothetical protein